MRRVFIAFESGAARLMCGCVYWCPLTPLNGGADARVLLSIVDLYLKMKVSYMLETLPKAQRTRGLSSSYESNLMGHITRSNTNLDQISSS